MVDSILDASNLCESMEQVFVTQLERVDQHTLKIVWSDGVSREWRLSELQAMCPCALCSGGRSSVEPDVSAQRIRSVGRYAFQVEFTKGCSSGIYRFHDLRERP